MYLLYDSNQRLTNISGFILFSATNSFSLNFLLEILPQQFNGQHSRLFNCGTFLAAENWKACRYSSCTLELITKCKFDTICNQVRYGLNAPSWRQLQVIKDSIAQTRASDHSVPCGDSPQRGRPTCVQTGKGPARKKH